jgi:histidinol-phosphate aminotransferase
MEAEDKFTPRIEEIAELIKERRPRAVFLCNPNNPTGSYLSRPDIEALVDAAGDGMIVIDEAYVAFVEEGWSSNELISRDNVVILRSMTKDYALAGLRLGYALAHREIISSLRRVCPPWNVNVVAQKIGSIVLEDDEYLEQSKSKIREVKKLLVDELSRLGFAPLPSETHFFLVKVGEADKFRSALLKEGILVRDCASFGLPEYVRIAPRTMPECRRLITAIESAFKPK